MRHARISIDLTEAWESWDVLITDPDAPEDVTSEWMEANPDGWELHDIRDSGSNGWSDLEVDDYDPREVAS